MIWYTNCEACIDVWIITMFSDLDLFANRNPCMSIPANPALPSRCAVDACLSPISKKNTTWYVDANLRSLFISDFSNKKTSEFSPISSLLRALKLLIQRHCGCGCCWPQLMGRCAQPIPEATKLQQLRFPDISAWQAWNFFTLIFTQIHVGLSQEFSTKMLGVLWLYLRLLGIETNSIYNFRNHDLSSMLWAALIKSTAVGPTWCTRLVWRTRQTNHHEDQAEICFNLLQLSMKLPMKNHWNEETKLGKETLEENPRLKALAVEMPRRTEPGVVGRSRWPGGIDVLPLLAKRKFQFKISNFYNFTWTVIKRIFSHLVDEWIDCEGLATWENLFCFFGTYQLGFLTIQWFWTEIHAVPPARAWAPNVFHWNTVNM